MLLVLGYGNTLCRDDGFGPAVVARLKKSIDDTPGVEILCEQQLLPEHAEKLAQCTLAIFIDISCLHEPGQVDCQALVPAKAGLSWDNPLLLPHSLSPSGLLAISANIYGRAPQAYLYTAGALSTELGEGLSPVVEQAVAQVSEMILTRVAALLSDH